MDPKYRPSPGTIRALAGPLNYGPAAANFLIEQARHDDDFDADELDLLAGEVTPAPGAGGAGPPGPVEAHRAAATVPVGAMVPSASDATNDAVQRLRAEMREQFDLLRDIIAGFAKIAEDGGRYARLTLAKRPGEPATQPATATTEVMANAH